MRNCENDQLIQTLKGHTHTVNCVLFSEKSEFLLSGSSDKTIRVWSTSEWKCKYILKEHSESIWSLGLIKGSVD